MKVAHAQLAISGVSDSLRCGRYLGSAKAATHLKRRSTLPEKGHYNVQTFALSVPGVSP